MTRKEREGKIKIKKVEMDSNLSGDGSSSSLLGRDYRFLFDVFLGGARIKGGHALPSQRIVVYMLFYPSTV
ncbi:hypothetical protein CAEBREN_07867 [Caenorhabditis brenneri]|uniref:Uncharacterized protein n=1 Tax=Caenorhabditis brenneri TaxID=135651 RepID=G0NA19_CAEBE|nr:hypothetical protein CAEBREN_07867 [Caenorhabditis brenneri]